jgi:hypothetical protein
MPSTPQHGDFGIDLETKIENNDWRYDANIKDYVPAAVWLPLAESAKSNTKRDVMIVIVIFVALATIATIAILVYVYVILPSVDVDCIIEYSAYGACDSVTGKKSRTHKITQKAQSDGAACTVTNLSTDCPVDCVGSYSAYGTCDPVTGTRSRTHNISTPVLNGGTACTVTNLSTDCPVDCVGSYTDYGECDPETGTKSRTHNISTPAKNGGTACTVTNLSTSCSPLPCALPSEPMRLTTTQKLANGKIAQIGLTGWRGADTWNSNTDRPFAAWPMEDGNAEQHALPIGMSNVNGHVMMLELVGTSTNLYKIKIFRRTDTELEFPKYIRSISDVESDATILPSPTNTTCGAKRLEIADTSDKASIFIVLQVAGQGPNKFYFRVFN